jgi:hypothetical protein
LGNTGVDFIVVFPDGVNEYDDDGVDSVDGVDDVDGEDDDY